MASPWSPRRWKDTEGLFGPGDMHVARTPEEMVHAIRYLIANPGAARDQAERGLERIRGRHTCRHRAQQLEHILADLGRQGSGGWSATKPAAQVFPAPTLGRGGTQATPQGEGALVKLTFFGSSLVSAYWNGAATYYRGLLYALAQRGFDITFCEPDAFDRQKHRDLAEDPEWARVVVYASEAERDALVAGRSRRATGSSSAAAWGCGTTS